jgi:hypothetical protein
MIAWSPPGLSRTGQPPFSPNRLPDTFDVQRNVKDDADALNWLLTGDTYFSNETKSNFLNSVPRVIALRRAGE